MATVRFTFLDAMALLFVVRATSSASDSLIDSLADGKLRPTSVAGLQVAYLPIVSPSSHASSLLDLKNGDLLCACYSRRWERKSDVAIVIARLQKGSSQWTKPEIVEGTEYKRRWW
jgi:predicted neuraminidase